MTIQKISPRREKIEILEKTVSDYENLPLSEHNIALESYNNCKSQLESYTNEKTKGHILRSKWKKDHRVDKSLTNTKTRYINQRN